MSTLRRPPERGKPDDSNPIQRDMPRVAVGDRLAAATTTLDQVNAALERLWLGRFELYAAFRAVRAIRRNLDGIRAELEQPVERR